MGCEPSRNKNKEKLGPGGLNNTFFLITLFSSVLSGNSELSQHIFKKIKKWPFMEKKKYIYWRIDFLRFLLIPMYFVEPGSKIPNNMQPCLVNRPDVAGDVLQTVLSLIN